ncbi:PH domain-containing protein [Cellulomonas fimi]|uniref:PH domain-containing protein n=1 Tax=Cellulomonas fimi TaxID=1708 RepID=A0A7Y0QFX5_CELFI|nr:PH domain-containing protein [Cellulomonas fimi]NMR18660.1 PH domain-containing protein [Cellulomonas fimi]
MIDFADDPLVKLSPWELFHAQEELEDILLEDEVLHLAFKGIRDSVTFTSRRIVSLNVQGITGRRKDYTSLPYSRIQAFSIETAGTLDLGSELELWFAGLGAVRLQFSRGVDIRNVSRLIGEKVM